MVTIHAQAKRRYSILAAVALAAGLMGLSPANAGPGAHGPNGEHLDEPGTAVNASGLARLPDGSVNVPKLAQRRMAIRTVLAPESEAAATVEMPGRVLMDPNASGRVQSTYGGRIEPGPKGLPVAGQAVKRGDVLAYVRHQAEPYALGAQRAQLAELRAQRQLAEQRVQRLEGLEGTVPRKEIEAARSEASSLAERERSISGSLVAREALTAPVSGVIARADLAVGQIVEPRDVLFEVVDPARMLVEATTADVSLAARVAGASLLGVPGVSLRLLGVSRSLRDGVVPLTFAVSPAKAGTALPSLPSLPLAIGQPATVVAQTKERIKGVVLPAQAVVRNPSNEPVVWITVRLDHRKAAQMGLAPGEAIRVLQALTDGAHGADIVDGPRRYELVLRLPDAQRSPQDLARTLIDTPAGRIPVSSIATVEETDGPNQIGRENGRRRIIVYANTEGGDMGQVIRDIRGIIANTPLPPGNFVSLEGQFQAQEQATRLIAGLSLVSLAMMFLVLYSRYRSVVLAGIVMANIPLALIGSVVAMWIAGVSLSVASMVGFITLAGIATRNGILKISHYINLVKFEGESFGQAMIVRGSLERLTPVLMTALVAAFALTPLLLAADAPGKEILHPVAVVIFGGLVSSTLLDTLLTPVLFWLFGKKATQRLTEPEADASAGATGALEAY
jgi:hypothetical protein